MFNVISIYFAAHPGQFIAMLLFVLLFIDMRYGSFVVIAIILPLVLLMMQGCVQFDRQWSTENRQLEVAYQVTHAVDGLQTLQIANQPERYSESSWMLPNHPTTGQVAVWYMGTAYGHAFVTNMLDERAPRWVCRTWQTLTILDAANAVRGNYQLGLRMGF